jgi:hypothetical protein
MTAAERHANNENSPSGFKPSLFVGDKNTPSSPSGFIDT